MDGGMIANDIAILQLDRDIHTVEADPFSILTTPYSDNDVSVVSYGQGRSEVLSRERRCALTRRYSVGVLEFDCDVTFGSSGAPVFAMVEGRMRILSVISAIAPEQAGGKRAYGMILPDQVTELRAQLRREIARPIVTAGARRVRVGQRTGIEARFVRP